MALLCATGAGASASPCDDAWERYNEFKSHSVMEASQYALTTLGADVRAACGAHALPVPPGSDVPVYRPHVRPSHPKPTSQLPPPPKPAASPKPQ